MSPHVVNIECSNNLNDFNKINYDLNNIYFIKVPFDFNDTIDTIDITPYDYQIEAVEKLNEYYKNNNRGILSIPCGCGKTFISYLFSNNYSHIIILSPLKEFALQNLDRFIEYGYDKNNTILIDSDGIRDNTIIEQKIRNNKKLLISTTYKSMDIIANYLDLFNDAIFIIDEYHNLSKSNISNKSDYIYKLIISNHKILFMSATPRIYDIEYNDDDIDYDLFGEIIYNMTFTFAINNKYITDYKIWLPAINENNEQLNNEISIYKLDNQLKNRCNYLYSCIINNGSRKTIIYCKDTNDMNDMIATMKTLNDFYSLNLEINSISCENSKAERKTILNRFQNNNENIQLLFNIIILNECIDIPKCDSIYISYPAKNKITTIQRISRAIRIDKNNPLKIANIYIWCNEYEDILETLSSIKEYDISFKDKIKLNISNFYNNHNEKEIKTIELNIQILNNYIINIKEYKQLTWTEKLELLENYIKENNKLPSNHNKDLNIRRLGNWILHQKTNYKNNEYIMKNENIRTEWELFIDKYKDLFKTNQEIWYDNLKKIQDYIKENNKLPSKRNNEPNIIRLGRFITSQKENYKNNEYIMKNDNIRKEWELFIEKYKELFKTDEEKWYDNLQEVENYIKENNKLPNQIDKDLNIGRLGKWISHQKKNYKNNEDIMKNEDIRKSFELFIDKYKELFKTNEEIWYDNLKELEDYIILNNKLPNSNNKSFNIRRLGYFISNQKRNYKNNKEIMKNEYIRKDWELFIDKYKDLFKTNEEIWYDNLKELEDYIILNNKLPSEDNKTLNIKKLGKWISHQKTNYKNNEYNMKNENIRKDWELFIEKYKL